jgi:NADH-quinone oxidoreductase subunit L
LIAAAGAIDSSTPIWLVPLLPLLGAIVLLFAGRRLREPLPGWIATILVASAFGVAVVEFAAFTGGAGEHLPLVNRLYEWIVAGPFHVEVAFRVDQLSLVMVLTVTGVGSLIHLYAIQYLHGDRRYTRFFAYFNLFVFFMLVLVLANNFLVLFVGWEGVGLCSYLLIGFWYERKSAADAAKKAFIVTRIGDAAFLLGIAYVWLQFRSLDFEVVFARAPELAPGVATIMALLLFAGAVGKSAQLPLQVWLPDAMEGPTPVSALIHAATMVTAGVYLVVRANSIFLASGVALDVVAWVGIVTAVYAGLCAIGQDDIKRMLAYSTISQLGFMFFGAGVGAFGAAIFLLVAHAFFKAMLFLDAGNVMHGLHEETDLMKMGALRRAMPVTAITWLIGWLAMSGIPPFSGFFAKDQVIAAASEHGHVALWIVALIGAFLTAVYMTRGTLLAFFGQPRTEVDPHEAPSLMRAAVIVLAVLASVGGLLGLTAEGVLVKFLEPVVGPPVENPVGPTELILTVISVAVAVLGIVIGYLVWGSGRIDWLALRARYPSQRRALQRGLYVDDLYAGALGGPGKVVSAFLAYVFDRRVIDGSLMGLGRVIGAFAQVGRKVQSGLVRAYAVGILLGVVAVLLYLGVRA